MTVNRNIGSRTQRRSIVERYLAKVDKTGGALICWPWTGAKDSGGYGNFWDGTYTEAGRPRMVPAHRWGYGHLIGDPGTLHVLHTCDDPPCQNPSHWFLGTHGANMADRGTKGRTRGGDNRGFITGGVKLTPAQVREIRATYTGAWGEQAALARHLGVSHQQISNIIRGKGWIEP